MCDASYLLYGLGIFQSEDFTYASLSCAIDGRLSLLVLAYSVSLPSHRLLLVRHNLQNGLSTGLFLIHVCLHISLVISDF